EQPHAAHRRRFGTRRARGRRPDASGGDRAPPRQQMGGARHRHPVRGGRRAEPAAGHRPGRGERRVRLPDLGSAPPRRADRDAVAHGRQRRPGRPDQRGPIGRLGGRRLFPRQPAQHGAPARTPGPAPAPL
ncbi:MAG: hypothetical protein AVDCRST_MAG08-371, partial [uncultured Acetobacteraceae bacterium]